ncbi:MAG: alpha/beta hydrolase-fold protein [Candidatus Aminicenantales bacterium]
MKSKKNIISLTIVILAFILSILTIQFCKKPELSRLRFAISFPASVHSEAITGRVFVMISRDNKREPRLQAGSWFRGVPFFGKDVEQLKPEEKVIIDENTLGYPLKSLKDIPPGDYFVQALINIYTKFHRSDGHTIWAHMDQWEGQQFNRSPGNLYSEVKSVHLDPAKGYTVGLSLDKIIPSVKIPEDSQWVKHIKIKSQLLSQFWGHPIYLGAVVLLPKGYDQYQDVYYPANYIQGHFSLRAPHGFREGSEFYKAWTSEDFPRMICVTFQHPCPYFDDSYAVNSANCGPYGDAIMKELIPYIEEHFRIIRKPYARLLSGGSTGGWEALALQIFHPDFFGGTWSFFPDPVDFRYYQLTNIYQDKNAFFKEFGWMKVERPLMRDVHGQVLVTMRQMSQLEAVLGSKGRSGQQLDIWQAVYGPVGDDGYPRPIWDKITGEIDHEVAQYFKEHYDVRYYLEKNWPKIGHQLVGKLHVFCGDMDNFYLNEAVYELEKFLESTKNPYYAGSFQYGRPRKGHGWTPFKRNRGELERIMADYIAKNAPHGENTSLWRYK